MSRERISREERRQAYLQAMGIQTCYPRRPLPGAGPSPDYDFPPPDATAEVAREVPSTRIRSAPQSGAARELLADTLRQKHRTVDASREPAPERGPVETTAESQAPAEQEALRFLLHYQAVDTRLALLWEVPHKAGRESLALSRQLLAAVLNALGLAMGEDAQDSFAWPLIPDMPAAQSGARQARQALAGFVTKCRDRDGFANLLVFSAQVDALLPGADTNAGRDWAAGDDYHTTCTHSLHSMLAMPDLKREAWEHLQPLRRRLQ